MALSNFPDDCGFIVDPIPEVPLISDCGIPDAYPPINDCPDVDLPIPVHGEPGPPGADGIDGVDGADGAPGAPGSPRKAYLLRKCYSNPALYMRVSNNLSNLIGKVIKLTNGECWIVIQEIDLTEEAVRIEALGAVLGADGRPCPGVCVEIAAVFNDCTTCRLPCWKLTDCDNPANIKYTRTNYAANEGKVIKIVGSEVCWQVTRSPIPCFIAEVTVLEQPYNDCASCVTCYNLAACHGDETMLANFDPTWFIGDATVEDIIEAEYVFRINDICYTIVDEAEDCVGAVLPPQPVVYDGCNDCSCYLFTRCGTETTRLVYATDDEYDEIIEIDTLFGKTVRLADGYCYTVSDTPISCVNAERVVVNTIFEDCDSCVYYELALMDVDCEVLLTYKTWENLSEYGVGGFVKSSGSCYEITGTTTDGTGAIEFDVDSGHTSCTSCQQLNIYKLSSPCDEDGCGGAGTAADWTDVITDDDLSDYVGQYVRYAGRCVLVEDGTGETVTESDLGIDEAFEDCPACNEGVTGDQPDMSYAIDSSTLTITYYVRMTDGTYCKRTLEIPLTTDCPE